MTFWLGLAVCLLFPLVLGWQIARNPLFLYSYSLPEYFNYLFAGGYFAYVFNGGILDTEFIPIQNVNILSCAAVYAGGLIPLKGTVVLWLGQSLLGLYFFSRIFRLIERWLDPTECLFAVILLSVHPLLWISLLFAPSQVLTAALVFEAIIRYPHGKMMETGWFVVLLLLSLSGAMGFFLAVFLMSTTIVYPLFFVKTFSEWKASVTQHTAASLAALLPSFAVYGFLSWQWQTLGGARLADYSTPFSELSFHRLLSGEWTMNAREFFRWLSAGCLELPVYVPVFGILALAGLQVSEQDKVGLRRLSSIAIPFLSYTIFFLTFVSPENSRGWSLVVFVLATAAAIRGLHWAGNRIPNYSQWGMASGTCLLSVLSLAAFMKPWAEVADRGNYSEHVCATIQQVLDTSPDLPAEEMAYRFSAPAAAHISLLRKAFPIGLHVLARFETVYAKHGGFQFDLKMAPAPRLVILYPRFEEITEDRSQNMKTWLPESDRKTLAHYHHTQSFNLDVFTRSSENKTAIFHGWLRRLYENGNEFEPEMMRPFYTSAKIHHLDIDSDAAPKYSMDSNRFHSLGIIDPILPLNSIARETIQHRVGMEWNFETGFQHSKQTGTAFALETDLEPKSGGGYYVSSGNAVTQSALGILESIPFTIEGDDLTVAASFPSDSTSAFFCLAVHQQAPVRDGVKHIFDHRPGELLMGGTFFYIKPSHLTYLSEETVRGWRVVRLMREGNGPGWQTILWPVDAWKNQQAVWMAADRDRNGSIRIDRIAQWKRPATLRWNFENGTYTGWQVMGTAFGTAPAFGSYGEQTAIHGYEGNFFINSFWNGSDEVTGTLTSPPFIVTGDRIEFLIGGGDDEDRTGVVLVVDEKIVLRETGERSESLRRIQWDIRAWRGKEARLRIIDLSRKPWGHILVDDIRIDRISKR